MFLGKFYFKLEEKGRISLPKSFRERATDWVVTRGLDGCLFMFKTDNFREQMEAVAQRTFTKKAHRDLARLMTNEAQEVKTDNLGRVQLPAYLTEFANLQKELVIVGSLERIEIWNRDSYHKYIDSIESQAEAIAESIENGNF